MKLSTLSLNRISCLSNVLKAGRSGCERITGTEYIAKIKAILPAGIHLSPNTNTSNLSPPKVKNSIGNKESINEIFATLRVIDYMDSVFLIFSDNSL